MGTSSRINHNCARARNAQGGDISERSWRAQYLFDMQEKDLLGALHVGEVDILLDSFDFYLLCANRIFALRLHRPLSFSATISLPNPQEESDSGSIYGFMELLKLFIAVDDKFYSYWNNENQEVQPQWLDEMIQTITNMLPTHIDYLQTSTVDTYITRQWLRVNIWKLQTRNSRDHNRAIRFKALVDICQELVDQLRNYSRVSLELQGLDLVIKNPLLRYIDLT
jgi:hypothetical protein